MWLLPWEKLPPLILGPLMIFLGIFVFLVDVDKDPTRRLEYLFWGVGNVVVGIGVTIYGIRKFIRDGE